jgi:hypothetical protein
LKVRESEWSPELQASTFTHSMTKLIYIGVREGARQLAAVEMNDLNSGLVDIDDVSNHLAPKFTATFSSILSVMEIQEIKERAKRAKQASQPESEPPASGSTITSRKRPPQSPLSSAPKRAKPAADEPSPPSEPKTPDQPIYPSNPDFTGASIESKDEENTKKLLFDMLRNTMSVLEADFRRITWQRSGHRVELSQTFNIPSSKLTGRERDNTKFVLGVETIIAINDGGLGVRYNTGHGYTQWQPGGVRPILSLEVCSFINPNADFEAKRQRSKKRDDQDLIYQYAGQIFCEMLGQTCYKEFYENDQMGYQEVIHLLSKY